MIASSSLTSQASKQALGVRDIICYSSALPDTMIPPLSTSRNVNADTFKSLDASAFPSSPEHEHLQCTSFVVDTSVVHRDQQHIDDVPLSLRHQLGVEDCDWPLRRPAIVGHRGSLYDELENTRAGFMLCALSGCDAVELDVFRLKDGELIVFHGGGTDENPGDLSEYCINQNGISVLDLTYDDCASLQFNPDFAEFGCCKEKITIATIPTLESVLRDLKSTMCNVKIELKSDGTPGPCLKLVEELKMLDQVQFSSFDHSRLKILRQLRPDKDAHGNYLVKTGALFNECPKDYIAQAVACGATEVHLRYDTCTKERVQTIHKHGFRSMAWVRGPRGMKSDSSTKFLDVGNEDNECYRALVATGVEQLCCNRPIKALNLVASTFGDTRTCR